ncbi:hypothetical protein C10C_0643 [Chlamydia serpentis]|uniref:Uncharacterized protein n=1 Tax=Chlamydia serpentis TaxID=1967782 RepID=A0A2R8FC10_9CHLA|nr:hypothetical protein [Chlamydia serpentis]SPN73797.1 hypothetical protein C10C_0643 [Chlamydia serpentis]
MSINPPGRKPDDLWIPGAHDQHPDVQESGKTSRNLGFHRVEATVRRSWLKRLRDRVANFFRRCFFRSRTTSSRSEAPTVTPVSSSSVEEKNARDIEGAAQHLIKRGYTRGKRVPTPTPNEEDANHSHQTSSSFKSGQGVLPKTPPHNKGRAPQPPKGDS